MISEVWKKVEGIEGNNSTVSIRPYVPVSLSVFSIHKKTWESCRVQKQFILYLILRLYFLLENKYVGQSRFIKVG